MAFGPMANSHLTADLDPWKNELHTCGAHVLATSLLSAFQVVGPALPQ